MEAILQAELERSEIHSFSWENGHAVNFRVSCTGHIQHEKNTVQLIDTILLANKECEIVCIVDCPFLEAATDEGNGSGMECTKNEIHACAHTPIVARPHRNLGSADDGNSSGTGSWEFPPHSVANRGTPTEETTNGPRKSCHNTTYIPCLVCWGDGSGLGIQRLAPFSKTSNVHYIELLRLGMILEVSIRASIDIRHGSTSFQLFEFCCVVYNNTI